MTTTTPAAVPLVQAVWRADSAGLPGGGSAAR